MKKNNKTEELKILVDKAVQVDKAIVSTRVTTSLSKNPRKKRVVKRNFDDPTGDSTIVL